MEETASDLVVRVEMPGVGKENFSIQIVGNTLFIRGEKQLARENGGSTYHLVERAYGSFERTIALPKNVDSEKSQANYVDGATGNPFAGKPSAKRSAIFRLNDVCP